MNSNKKSICDGAIFDQDGLLFDTEVLFERSWKQAGAEFGVSVPDEMTNRCCGCGKGELPGVVSRFFPEIDIPAYIERVLELAAEAQLASVPVLKSGVMEILRKCRENGVKTAIASSSMRHLVDHNLSTSGLSGFFDAIVTGGDVERGKPAPDIFLLAASKLGVEPSKCVVFEDAFSGIRAAHAAGCRPILIPDRVKPVPEILEICDCRTSLLEALEFV
ncbi:MAG: HAD family phosphatase [Kiritimatiellae bacterium]|nr:HAD family phosphatase [Kiritimatiellia bacterium]